MKLFRKSLITDKPEGTFVEDRLRTKKVQRRTAIALLSGTAVLGWLYIFFFSTTFTVQKIEVEGIKTLERGGVEKAAMEAIDNMRTWPFRFRNIFFIDEKSLSSELKDTLFTQSVIVDKIYPNILRLKIQERQSSLVLMKGTSFWQIDRSGIITRLIDSDVERAQLNDRLLHPVKDPSSVLPILEISQDVDPVVGNTYVTDFRVSLWLDTFKSLQDKGFGYRHALVEYATSTKLILNMFEPYEVYIDLMEPIEPQIDGYYEFKRAKKDVEIKEYLDARIPGRIYYQ